MACLTYKAFRACVAWFQPVCQVYRVWLKCGGLLRYLQRVLNGTESVALFRCWTFSCSGSVLSALMGPYITPLTLLIKLPAFVCFIWCMHFGKVLVNTSYLLSSLAPSDIV